MHILTVEPSLLSDRDAVSESELQELIGKKEGEVKNFLKKTMFMGLGLAALTKEKAEELAREIADRTKMTEEEGREFVKYMREETEKARTRLETRIDDMVDEVSKRVPGKKRLAAIETRLAAIEARLDMATGETPEEPGCNLPKTDTSGTTPKKSTTKKSTGKKA